MPVLPKPLTGLSKIRDLRYRNIERILFEKEAGLMNWFRRKKLPDEKSPGGSFIFRHDRLSAPQIGVPEESVQAFRQAREEVYGQFFGATAGVSQETAPLVSRIDVHTYYRRAKEGRRVCTLVTSGMSDLEMDAPGGGIRRAELIFYCDEPKPEYIETIRWLARFPHDQKTWVGY